ncbi:MAG: hypothetical protein IJ677_06310 [Alphaproteobacteria bacterium]|nr:hypothetical protein [Alphaproteobacteria bacterium]
MADDRMKKCPEYCPFLMANGTFCELFKRTLQSSHGLAFKCEDCLNPEQRMSSYKALGLSVDSRAEMWQKAILKHNEIELGKRRQEEMVRKKFSEFLEDKFGSRPPLSGNSFLKNLIVNIYMVLDATERNMMMTLLNSRKGDVLVEAIEKAPKDESLLRNVRRELDLEFTEYQQTIQKTQYQNININAK